MEALALRHSQVIYGEPAYKGTCSPVACAVPSLADAGRTALGQLASENSLPGIRDLNYRNAWCVRTDGRCY